MKENLQAFFLGIVAFAILLLLAEQYFPTYTHLYMEGVRATQKEALEHGLMTKEVDKDDKVIYRWIETHSLGYE